MPTITQVVFPNNPQFDPIAAYFLLLKYGEKAFPGIREAHLSVWHHAENPSQEQIQEWEEQGFLALDVGGGNFDHHNKTEKTVAGLVAEYLGVAENPELQTLLEYAWEDDQHGLHNKYGELPYIIKALYKQGKDVWFVVTTNLELLETLQAHEYHWRVETKKEFDAKAVVERIQGTHRTYRVAFLKSDDIDVANYARQFEKIDLILQQNSSGHTFIFTNKSSRIDLVPILLEIRTEEAKRKNPSLQHLPKDFAKPGKHPLVPEWYYHPSLKAILNGSFALKETPPTQIPWETLQTMVQRNLARNQSHHR